MIATDNGFTQDVKTLLSVGNLEERLRIMRDIPEEERAAFIFKGIARSLADFMMRPETPAFVAQIVGRALTDHVDWEEVSRWCVVNHESN